MDSNSSAVIVLLDDSTDSLILTQRSAHLRDHPGEICFPGGHWQPGDTDLFATGLRELEEELGIEPKRVTLIKPLQVVHTIEGKGIHPWFATVPSLEPYRANSFEVAQVLQIPMKEVLKGHNYKEVIIERRGKDITTVQFKASTFFIWGATVRIMKLLVGYQT